MLHAFRDLRISIKAMLPILLLALVGLGAGGLIARTLVTTDIAYSTLLDHEARASTQAARLNALVLGLGREVWEAAALRDPAVLTTAIRNIEAMGADANARATPIRAGVAGTPSEAELARFERDFPGLVAGAVRGLKQVQAGQTSEALAFLQGDFARSFTELRNLSRKIMNDMLAATNAQSAVLSAESESAARMAIVALGLGIALSLAFGIWLTRATILQPFARLGDTVQRLAAGNHAGAVAGAERGDEVGAMARALQGLASRLQEAATLRAEQEAQQRRAEQERREGLLAMADSLESSVGTVVEGIASATTELSAAATSIVGIADATSRRAATVSGATGIASGNVGTVAAATEELAASVAEISRQVSDSARMAAGAVDQANRTNATVSNLTEAAAKIGEMTRLIGDIAGQTNLLALNATIEAAPAGEAGKGFAVVASEVKALANQTAQATSSIATQIQAMQAATRDAAADIGAIRESIGQINQVTAAIAAAVEQQGSATRDIAENVQRAAQGTAEIASAIDGVTGAAGETGGATSQVQATSATLAQQAETLRAEVGNFLGRVCAA